MKIISIILILVTLFFSIRHGWAGINIALKPGNEPNLLTDLGLNNTFVFIFSALTLVSAILVLFPQTFFIANLLNAMCILLIMALALKAGQLKTALIEIPFLLLPLVLIWLGHPLKK